MSKPENRISVLILNNDEYAIKLFQSSLEEYDYLVKTTNSFQELFNIYKMKKFDVVILTNLGLSANRILELVTKLSEFDSRIRIIVLSGVNEPNLVLSLVNAGVKKFFKLPVDFDDIHSCIQKLISIS